MKFHIVQVGEDIDDILFLYNISKDELIEENKHIKKWDRLIPGMKLKIPTITEMIASQIEEMEPFIEDYYPKLDSSDLENEENYLEEEEKIDYQYPKEIEENIENEVKNSEKISTERVKKDDEQKIIYYPCYVIRYYPVYYPVYYRY